MRPGRWQGSTERASMAKSTANYGNDSIRQLKDEERVRLRPAVIFGSDGLDGCAHAAFEILSNSVDEAREGYGNRITVTASRTGPSRWRTSAAAARSTGTPPRSATTGSSCSASSTPAASTTTQGGDYEFSLGPNGLGLVRHPVRLRVHGRARLARRHQVQLHFKKGEASAAAKGALRSSPQSRPAPRIRWRPISRSSPPSTSRASSTARPCKRQAVVNAGVTVPLRIEAEDGIFTEEDFCYEQGHRGLRARDGRRDDAHRAFFIEADRRGRDREDKPDYKVKMHGACASPHRPDAGVLPQLLAGWRTAARPRRRSAAPLTSAARRLHQAARASTTRTRARSRGRTCRTASCSSPTPSPPRPPMRTRPRRPSTTASSSRP